MEVPEMLYSIKVIPFPKEIKDKIDLENRKTTEKNAMEKFASETLLSAQH